MKNPHLNQCSIGIIKCYKRKCKTFRMFKKYVFISVNFADWLNNAIDEVISCFLL